MGDREHAFGQHLAASMDVEAELFEVLADLFVDLEDLGARAEDVTALLGPVPLPCDALDLGCGKGAVAIALAEQGATVTGVDGYPAFVAHARGRAQAAGVEDRCTFVLDDVRKVVASGARHDLVLMLALGEVLGDLGETLRALFGCVRPGGRLVLDDAYLRPGVEVDEDAGVLGRADMLAVFAAEGWDVVGERAMDHDDHRRWLRAAASSVSSRARALAEERPDLAPALHAFARRQEIELAAHEQWVVGVLWCLRRSIG